MMEGDHVFFLYERFDMDQIDKMKRELEIIEAKKLFEAMVPHEATAQFLQQSIRNMLTTLVGGGRVEIYGGVSTVIEVLHKFKTINYESLVLYAKESKHTYAYIARLFVRYVLCNEKELKEKELAWLYVPEWTESRKDQYFFYQE